MVSLFGLPHHIASAYFCILVFCFVLFFFVGKINWNCTKTLNIPFGGFRTRIKKMKNALIYWPQGQWGGVRARYCAPVHSYAVKWSRNTKWKMTVDRLFTSRQDGTYRLSLSWSWLKVLTLISWFPACCQDMFQKGLSKGTESAVTLSTVREMMYFTKTKRCYFWFAPPPTPESPPQDRFKVLPMWLRGG